MLMSSRNVMDWSSLYVLLKRKIIQQLHKKLLMSQVNPMEWIPMFKSIRMCKWKIVGCFFLHLQMPNSDNLERNILFQA